MVENEIKRREKRMRWKGEEEVEKERKWKEEEEVESEGEVEGRPMRGRE